MSERRNPHEEAARARKVLALLAVVPTGDSKEENAIIAEFLTGLSVPERAIFAKLAKVNAPSADTWKMLVDGVRARVPVSEIGQ